MSGHYNKQQLANKLEARAAMIAGNGIQRDGSKLLRHLGCAGETGEPQLSSWHGPVAQFDLLHMAMLGPSSPTRIPNVSHSQMELYRLL